MSQVSTSNRPLHSHSKSSSHSKSASNKVSSPPPTTAATTLPSNGKHHTLRTSVLDAAVKLGLDNPQVAGWLFNPISEEAEESEADSQPPLTADEDSLSTESPFPPTPEIQQAPLATVRVGATDPRLYSPSQQSHVPPSAVHHPVGAHLYALGPQPLPQKPKLRKIGPPPAAKVARETAPAPVGKEAEKRKKREAKEREKEREKGAKEREKEAKEREKEAKEREKEIREREAREKEARERGREARKDPQIDEDGSGKKGLMSKFRLKSKERKASEPLRPSSPPPPVPAPVVLPIAAMFAAKPSEDADPAQSPAETNRVPSPSTVPSLGRGSEQARGRAPPSSTKRFERPPSPPWSKPLDGAVDESGDRSTYYAPAPVVRPRTPSPPRQPQSPQIAPLEPVRPLVIKKPSLSPSHSPSISPSLSPSHSPTHSESGDKAALEGQGPTPKQKPRGGGFGFPIPNPGSLLGMGRTKSPSHSRQPSEEDANDHSHSPVVGSPAPSAPSDLPPSNRSKPRPAAMQFQATPVPLSIKTVISSTPVTQTHEIQRNSTAVSLLDVGGALQSRRSPSPLNDSGRPISPPNHSGRPRSPTNGGVAPPPPSFTTAIQRESQEAPSSAPLQNQRKPSLSGWPSATPHSALPQSSSFLSGSPQVPQSALPQSSSFVPSSPQVPQSALPQSSTFLSVGSSGAQLTAKPSQRGRMPAFPTTPTNPGAVTRSNTRNNGLPSRPRLYDLGDDGSGAFLPPHPSQAPKQGLTRQASQLRRQGLLNAPPSLNIDTTDDEALQVFPRRKREPGQKTRRAVRFEMDLSDDEDFRRREPHGPLPTIIIPGHLRSGSQAQFQPQTKEARRRSFLESVEHAPPANRLQPGLQPGLTLGNNRRRSTYYSSHDGGYNSDGASTEASRLSDYARFEPPTERDDVDKRISVSSNYSEQLNRLSKFIATESTRASSYLDPNDRLSVLTPGDRFSKMTLGSRISFAESRLSAVSDFDVAAYYGLPGSEEKKRAEEQNRHSTLNVDKERQREIGRNRLVRMLTPPEPKGRGYGMI